MEAVETWISDIGGLFWSWLVLPIVVVLGVYFTVRTGVVQFRMLPAMFRTLFDKTPKDAQGRDQSISSFQAFTVSAASRVGVGNIAGVGSAIAIGGPGAVFWMWLMALVGAASAFIESTLAQLYKHPDPPDGFRGGPAYYMQRGLRRRWVGVLFAVVLVICFPIAFSSLQANTITDSISTTTGVEAGWLKLSIGIVLAAVTGLVVFGGVRRIARITDKLVPAMALLYLLVGIVIVAINIGNVPSMVTHIFTDAFTANSVTGAAVGSVILAGVQRGMFSNEAGLGSAPNAGASAAVTHPAKQGFVQSLGVYFDTLLVCSITAFIILSSDPDLSSAERGIGLTQNAMTSALGGWAGSLLTVVVFLLAYSSILGNYYYGESNIEFIARDSRMALTAFRVVAVLAVLAGSLLSASLVWTVADQIMGLMALINLIAIFMLSGVAIRVLQDYTRKSAHGGEIVFTLDDYRPPGEVEFWHDRATVTGIPQPSAEQRT